MFAQSVCMNVVNGINVSTLKYLTLFSSLSRLDSTIDGFFFYLFCAFDLQSTHTAFFSIALKFCLIFSRTIHDFFSVCFGTMCYQCSSFFVYFHFYVYFSLTQYVLFHIQSLSVVFVVVYCYCYCRKQNYKLGWFKLNSLTCKAIN